MAVGLFQCIMVIALHRSLLFGRFPNTDNNVLFFVFLLFCVPIRCCPKTMVEISALLNVTFFYPMSFLSVSFAMSIIPYCCSFVFYHNGTLVGGLSLTDLCLQIGRTICCCEIFSRKMFVLQNIRRILIACERTENWKYEKIRHSCHQTHGCSFTTS